MKRVHMEIVGWMDCQRSFKSPQVWSSKFPTPLLNTTNNNYACGRFYEAALSSSPWKKSVR